MGPSRVSWSVFHWSVLVSKVDSLGECHFDAVFQWAFSGAIAVIITVAGHLSRMLPFAIIGLAAIGSCPHQGISSVEI